MSFDAETLYRLLPAIYRIRDAELAGGMADLLTAKEAAELRALDAIPDRTPLEQARRNELQEKAARGPLKALCYVIAEQLGVVEENLEQLYDDLFIETCADWVVPYIGDLIGFEPLHPLGEEHGPARAEAAHTIALRRRKGTAAVLEQLARDVTGWNARAVEFFQVLATTQYMNHPRLGNLSTPEMRRWEPLSRIGGAFDSVARTVDVRHIESGRGKYNIPNIGIFLWRLKAYRHKQSPAVRLDDRRWFISPLGHPLQLFHHPRAEEEITHLAEPVNVSEPISRRILHEYMELYYGSARSPTGEEENVDNVDPSIVLYIDGKEVARTLITACDLSDAGSDWRHRPPNGRYALDPVLGRIALSDDLPVPQRVEVTFHRGFSADIGGGEYERERATELGRPLRVPEEYPTIQSALDALGGDGTVVIENSGRYDGTLAVTVLPGRRIALRAANGCAPTLVVAAAGEVTVRGGEDSEFVLDGVLLTAARDALHAGSDPQPLLRVPVESGPVKLTILDSTLVPGRALDVAGKPLHPGAPGIQVDAPGVAITLDRSIAGAFRLHGEGEIAASDSIIDATAPGRAAIAGNMGSGPAGKLSLTACTVIGRLNIVEVGMISNSLLFAYRAEQGAEPNQNTEIPIREIPIQAWRRQTGCVRFSYLPIDSRVPMRHQCQPNMTADATISPSFVSLRFGVGGYCQLAVSTPGAIRRGADDEGEMGAFHHLFPAQREANLRVRLREFLRVGLEAGVFYES